MTHCRNTYTFFTYIPMDMSYLFIAQSFPKHAQQRLVLLMCSFTYYSPMAWWEFTRNNGRAIMHSVPNPTFFVVIINSRANRLNSPYVASEGHHLRRRSTRCRIEPKAQVKNFYGQIISMAYFSVWYEWNNKE